MVSDTFKSPFKSRECRRQVEAAERDQNAEAEYEKVLWLMLMEVNDQYIVAWIIAPH